MEGYPYGVDADLQLAGDLQVAHFTQVPEAKDVSFLRRQLSYGHSQVPAQIQRLDVLERVRAFVARCGIACVVLMSLLEDSLPHAVDRPRGGQVGQQAGEVPNVLAARYLQRREERFLEAVGGIRVVAEQTVRRPPYERPIPFDNGLPVVRLQE